MRTTLFSLLHAALRPVSLVGVGGTCCLLAGALLFFTLQDLPSGDTASSTSARSLQAAHAPVPFLPRPTAAFTETPEQLAVPYRPSYGAPDRRPVSVLRGVRYDDPTGGGLPLQWVDDRHDRWLSAGLRLSDFAANDGAPLVRISPDLVEGLERVRLRAGELVILSGYRHPAHNAAVGGAGDSQHQAGKAADVWSPNHPPLELARMALEELGCDIGLGLGPRSLHVDVRGELTSWTYEDAPLPGPTFAAWVYAQCGMPVPADVAARAASRWLDEGAPDQDARADVAAGPTSEEALLARFEPSMIAAAAAAYAVNGAGAAVVDLKGGSTAVRYLPMGDPGLQALQLEELVTWCAERVVGRYFAYAILRPDGPPLTGVMSL